MKLSKPERISFKCDKCGSLARHIIESWIEDKNKKSNEAI